GGGGGGGGGGAVGGGGAGRRPGGGGDLGAARGRGGVPRVRLRGCRGMVSTRTGRAGLDGAGRCGAAGGAVAGARGGDEGNGQHDRGPRCIREGGGARARAGLGGGAGARGARGCPAG